MSTLYRVIIATGKVIHDVVEIEAETASAARRAVETRIDAGEFDRQSVNLSDDPERPLVIHFPAGSSPHIVNVDEVSKPH